MNHILRMDSPAASERQWAAAAHLSALLLALLTSWIAGIAGVLGAGTVYALKRDQSAFVAEHAREALNFNLSMLVYAAAAVAAGVVLVGATVMTLGLGLVLTLPAGIALALVVAAIALLWLVCSIVATAKAWNGELYRYPFTLRLIG
ncbi:MAG TPA: DUF4870 domain-containing protein [Luteimonas sp.]|nr:DUF4870 domain-containing protein [Luteimonas sp.]